MDDIPTTQFQICIFSTKIWFPKFNGQVLGFSRQNAEIVIAPETWQYLFAGFSFLNTWMYEKGQIFGWIHQLKFVDSLPGFLVSLDFNIQFYLNAILFQICMFVLLLFIMFLSFYLLWFSVSSVAQWFTPWNANQLFHRVNDLGWYPFLR